MPELPEVEAYRRFFAEHATGRVVRAVDVLDPEIVRNASPEDVGRLLTGHRFDEPGRQGKWLVCPAGGPALVFHFGMTGDFIWSGDEPHRHRHDRLVLVFDEGELRYRNMRRLGGVWLAENEEDLQRVLDGLGPDALAIERDEFLESLSRRRGGVKALLMNQRLVSGIGNLLADEILWQARIHPLRRVEDLNSGDRTRLFRTMHRVLAAAVDDADYLDTKRRWLSRVRGRAEGRCPRCGTTLSRIVVAGRTTYLCATCQR